MTIRAFEIQKFGLENLVESKRPDPEPGPNEVVVEVKAASLNFRDYLMATGRYNPRQKLPLVPLSDGAGEVAAVGSEVTRVGVGDRVVGTFVQGWVSRPPPDQGPLRNTLGGPLDGMLAERVRLHEDGVVKAPPHLSWAEAATLPCAALTAWSALVTQATLSEKSTLVVQGTGGVSIFALQIARTLGAKVIATSSSDAKLERAKALGASSLINYKTTPEWGKEVLRLTDKVGADHVIEVGGTGTLGQSLRAVRPGGCISIIGVLTGERGEVNLIPILMRNIRLQGVSVGCRDELEAMIRSFSETELRPVVDRVFPFDAAPEAFRYLAEGKHFGKVVIKVGG